MNTFEKYEELSYQPSIAELRKEERRWFSWLSVLHERVSKAEASNAAVVLDIAKKRWLSAREALSQQRVGAEGRRRLKLQDNFGPQPDASSSCTGRPDS